MPSTPSSSRSVGRYAPYGTTANQRAQPRTPEPQPYRIPSSFALTGTRAGSDTSITDRNEIHALRAGIRVARRLVFSDRGLRLLNANLTVHHDRYPSPQEPLPPPVNWQEIGVDPRIAEQLLHFQRFGQVVVIVDDGLTGYGRMSEDRPLEIRIRRDLVTLAGRAYELRYVSPTLYASHVFFLATTIAHEYAHIIRCPGMGVLFRTPPSVIDGRHGRVARGSRSRPSVRHGEGGFWLERQLLGGRIEAKIFSENDPYASFPFCIETLFVSVTVRGSDQHFSVRGETIRAIVEELPYWERLLPLRPESPNQWVDGAFDGLRLRDLPPKHHGIRPRIEPAPVQTTCQKGRASVPRSHDSTLSGSPESDLNVIEFAGPLRTVDASYIARLEAIEGVIPPIQGNHMPLAYDDKCGYRCSTPPDETKQEIWHKDDEVDTYYGS